jgi:hypothetical protein
VGRAVYRGLLLLLLLLLLEWQDVASHASLAEAYSPCWLKAVTV